jgi:hypothetical protein
LDAKSGKIARNRGRKHVEKAEERPIPIPSFRPEEFMPLELDSQGE